MWGFHFEPVSMAAAERALFALEAGTTSGAFFFAPRTPSASSSGGDEPDVVAVVAVKAAKQQQQQPQQQQGLKWLLEAQQQQPRQQHDQQQPSDDGDVIAAAPLPSPPTPPQLSELRLPPPLPLSTLALPTPTTTVVVAPAAEARAAPPCTARLLVGAAHQAGRRALRKVAKWWRARFCPSFPPLPVDANAARAVLYKRIAASASRRQLMRGGTALGEGAFGRVALVTLRVPHSMRADKAALDGADKADTLQVVVKCADTRASAWKDAAVMERDAYAAAERAGITGVPRLLRCDISRRSALFVWLPLAAATCDVGQLLEAQTPARRLSRRGVLGVVRDVGATLFDMHAAGFTHNDIKPQNLVLAGSVDNILSSPEASSAVPPAYLVDFGVSMPVGEVLCGGTWGFQPPDALAAMDAARAGNNQAPAYHVSPAGDMYALGVTLAMMLARQAKGPPIVMSGLVADVAALGHQRCLRMFVCVLTDLADDDALVELVLQLVLGGVQTRERFAELLDAAERWGSAC